MQALWQPSLSRIQQAKITQYTEWLSQRELQQFADYAELHQWSCEHKEKFWPALWEFAELKYHKKWDQVYTPGKEFFTGLWFTGMQLNFAENLLRYRDEQVACVFCSEDGRYSEITYKDLYLRVAEIAAGLRAAGVTVGDRVAGILPNLPETIIAMLAATSLGATWASCSPDFGAEALLDRLGQLQPKVIFTTDGYTFKGQPFSTLNKIVELQRTLSTTNWVVIPYLAKTPDLSAITQVKLWQDFLVASTEINFIPTPFNHPLYIMFSS